MSVVVGDPMIAKYDVAGPRYTSYPTVPYWDVTPSAQQWISRIADGLNASEGQAAALYLHIPFCRSLCTYCGCNTRITRGQDLVLPYIQTLLRELDMYLSQLQLRWLSIGELHLGGGTPTYLSAEQLNQLLAGLFQRVQPTAQCVASLEVDPRVTSDAQLEVVARHGFRHLSLGVQDFDPRVQDIVNRVQSEQQVREVTQAGRRLGFDSINYDLIYGLPLQTCASVEMTLEAVSRLRPDRVAFYGYSHVPWIRPGQRRFTQSDLPDGDERRALYELGRARLVEQGYREIGLDHFALESDDLWRSAHTGTLHRHFMGYTHAHADPMIGLGVSSIGDAGDAFCQNEKDLQRYYERVNNGELPLQRGHLLDEEDRILRRHILRLVTRLETHWDDRADYTEHLASVAGRLAEAQADGLVKLERYSCRVTDKGRAFLRNICMAFDARLLRRFPDKQLFNQAM
jgi:oxygen-independent coproporphyrinogen-3 oxidase